VEPEAGVALYRPDVIAGGRSPSVLAFNGVLYPERTPDDALLGQLRRRDATAIAALRGEFTLALWDGPRARLLLARDHLGQRKLFVRSDEDFHLFSSELEPLLRDPAFTCELDFESAFHYLACGLPPPGHTLARGVSCVPAAHLLSWEPGRSLLAQRYWTPLDEEAKKLPDDDAKAAISAALDGAIASRLDGGVQAILLSGGVDSSYIAATAAAHIGPARLQSYTIEFTARYRKNETEYARLVAQAAGIPHRIVPLHAPAALALLEPTLAVAEPCSAWATVTHRHLLAAIAEDGHQHLLSGLGSDEVFGGYNKLLDFYFRSRKHFERWPAQEQVDSFAALLWDREAGRTALYPGVARFFSDEALARSLARPFRRWHFATHLEEFYRECRRLKPGAHVFEMMIAHECQRRIPDLLFVDFEPVARQLGVRTAYPFLDPDLIKRVCGLGAVGRYWLESRTWWNKKTLRELAAARIPATILARKPTSYTAPFADWMREPVFARPTLARLRRSRFWRAGLVRPELLGRVVADMEREPVAKHGRVTPWVDQLWALLTLAAWYDHYVERRS
jgi:asparagine synthase (glutamine-hydrolysing)